MGTPAPDQEREAEGEQQVGEQRADHGGPDHLEQAGAQGHHGDDQLGQVAEGGVKEPAHGGPRARREMLGAVDDQAGQGHDGQGGAKEDERAAAPMRSSAAATGAAIRSP